MAYPADYNFWAHGATVFPEYKKEFTGTDLGLYLRRAGFGAMVRQRGGTWNWFHIPIPTPTRLDDDASHHKHAWLRVNVNNDAVIREVTVHETQSNGSSPRIFQQSLNITGQNGQFGFNLPDGNCAGPLVMSIRVQFDTNNGQVIFTAAGAKFEEQ